LLERLTNLSSTLNTNQMEREFKQRRTMLQHHGRHPYVLDKEGGSVESVQKGFNYTTKAAKKQPFFSVGWAPEPVWGKTKYFAN
jgi:hypothetical protein